MRIQDQGLSLRIRANIDIMMVLREVGIWIWVPIGIRYPKLQPKLEPKLRNRRQNKPETDSNVRSRS